MRTSGKSMPLTAILGPRNAPLFDSEGARRGAAVEMAGGAAPMRVGRRLPGAWKPYANGISAAKRTALIIATCFVPPDC